MAAFLLIVGLLAIGLLSVLARKSNWADLAAGVALSEDFLRSEVLVLGAA